jgi:hypothetical protein
MLQRIDTENFPFDPDKVDPLIVPPDFESDPYPLLFGFPMQTPQQFWTDYLKGCFKVWAILTGRPR